MTNAKKTILAIPILLVLNVTARDVPPVLKSDHISTIRNSNMAFTKLVPGITKSSLWSTPEHVRVVWVSFLAEKDENGFCGYLLFWYETNCEFIGRSRGQKIR
jgi:hypothetical protein